MPGSSKSYTPAQIDDLMNPPDWFPDEHAPAPALVQKGHGTALACGACHLMSGEGHPESAGLTGFTAAYLVQQMADFKSGARKDSARMNAIAKDVTDEESMQVAEWFAALKPGQWTKVTEADTVPKTIVGQGRMRFLAPAGGTEPIGNRIITVPQDQARARNRDPKSGFIAYVPIGSIAKGKALVETAAAPGRPSRAASATATTCAAWRMCRGWRAFTRSTSRGSSTSSRTARETASTRS